MSAGSTVKPVRFPAELLAATEAAIAAINRTRVDAPYDFSQFVRKCVQDKLDHLARSRAPRTKRSKAR